MGLRLWRRFRIAPGVTVNLSKSGASVSIGARGAHVTFGRRGVRQTVGIPGTGVYYTEHTPWRDNTTGNGSEKETREVPLPMIENNPASQDFPESVDSSSSPTRTTFGSNLPVPAGRVRDPYTGRFIKQTGQAPTDRRGGITYVKVPFSTLGRSLALRYNPWGKTTVLPSIGLLPEIAEEAQTLRSETEFSEFVGKLIRRATEGLPDCPKHLCDGVVWAETGCCLKCNPGQVAHESHWVPPDDVDGKGHWAPGPRHGVLAKLRNGELRKLQLPSGKALWESNLWQKYYEDFQERMTDGNGDNYPGEAEDVDRVIWNRYLVEAEILEFMKCVWNRVGRYGDQVCYDPATRHVTFEEHTATFQRITNSRKLALFLGIVGLVAFFGLFLLVSTGNNYGLFQGNTEAVKPVAEQHTSKSGSPEGHNKGALRRYHRDAVNARSPASHPAAGSESNDSASGLLVLLLVAAVIVGVGWLFGLDPVTSLLVAIVAFAAGLVSGGRRRRRY
jgi:Protein of unknown function (DUF4236)